MVHIGTRQLSRGCRIQPQIPLQSNGGVTVAVHEQAVGRTQQPVGAKQLAQLTILRQLTHYAPLGLEEDGRKLAWWQVKALPQETLPLLVVLLPMGCPVG